MRPITMMQAQWRAETKAGESLCFENCKGGYFSNIDEYGLKVIGKTRQNSLSGKNLCYSYSKRTRGNAGTQTNTTKRILDANCYYVGFAASNYFNNKDSIVSMSIDGSKIVITHGNSGIGYGVGLPIKVNPNTQYTFSFKEENGIGYAAFAFYAEEGNYLGLLNPARSPISFTTPENCVTCCAVLGDRPLNTTFIYSDIQLEKGSTATAYEPYCGGIPSPSPNYPQEIQCVKSGTKNTCGSNEIIVPCDVYEGDIWYPISGKVKRQNGIIESYNGELITGKYTSTTGGLDIGAKVVYELDEPVIEQYEPQPIFAPQGVVNVLQEPIQLNAALSATHLVRR